MKKIEPYPVAIALFFISEIFYVVCIVGKYILLQIGIEGFWHMHKIWAIILPGFNELNFLSFIIGLIEVGVGAYSIVYILVPTYNYFIRKQLSNIQSVPKPFILKFKTVFFTILTYTFILFTLCFVYDLFVPKEYDMSFIWKLLLPGFENLTLTDYLIGVIDIIIYSVYTASIFTGVINYIEKTESVEV